MAGGRLRIFRKFFSLNCDISDLKEFFTADSRTAIVGSADNAGMIVKWLGSLAPNPVSNYFKPCIKNFDISEVFDSREELKNYNFAVVHLGNAVPSEAYFRKAAECFSPDCRVLYIMEHSVQELLGGISAALNAYIVSFSGGLGILSHRYDPTLPSIIVLPPCASAGNFCTAAQIGLGNNVYTLARDYTVLRENLVEALISSAAGSAASIAFASGCSTSIPVIGELVGFFAVPAETLYLTSEQVKLALIIGALYGKPLDTASRIHEIMPIVGSSFGWKTLAREAVGFIPAVGMLSKAAVAWAGTRTVGKVCARFYELGEPVDEDLKREIFLKSVQLSESASLK